MTERILVAGLFLMAVGLSPARGQGCSDAGYDRIELLYKDGSLPTGQACVRDIAEASDNLGIQAMARPVEKFYLAWPRWLGGLG